MASNPLTYPSGLSSVTSDDPLLNGDNLWFYADASTNVYWVSSTAGDNANVGSVTAPWATLRYALTQIGAGDLIIVRASHVETIETTTLTVASRCFIFGEGAGDARPTFTPAINGAGFAMTVTADAVVRGLRFLASSVFNGSGAVGASAAPGFRLMYCDFVCGPNDQGTKVVMSSTASFVHDCTFSSTAISDSARPIRALSGAQWVFNTTFTGGTYGWQSTTTFLHGWGNFASGPVGIGGTSTVSVIQCEISDGAYFDGTASPDYRVYPEGLGMVGHPLISGKGLYTSGKIRYVNSVTGADASAAGQSAGYPYDTLKYAINTAQSTGLLVVAAGHTENITTAAIVADDAALIVVGEGTGDNRPTITRAWDGIGITMNALGGQALCNLIFAKSSVAVTASAKVRAHKRGVVFHSCLLYQGDNERGSSCVGFSFGYDGTSTYGQDGLIWACEVVSQATAGTTQPVCGISGEDADNIHVLDCIVDGGAYGWLDSDGIQVGFGSALVENLTLLRASQCAARPFNYQTYLNALIQVSTMTGGSGVVSDVL